MESNGPSKGWWSDLRVMHWGGGKNWVDLVAESPILASLVLSQYIVEQGHPLSSIL